MKKLNVMLHTEVIECLRELSDETLAKVMRMIFDWNDGLSVEPKTEVERFAWKMIVPKLESNKETFLQKCEINSLNGKKGGAPKGNTNAKKNRTSEGLIETSENNPKQHNSNYNSSDNSSKDELSNIGQHTSPDGDDVVSKGLEKLESIFPPKKNYVDIDTVNLWNSFTQEEKQLLIRKASVYIREELKKNEGTYIKQMSKWLREQKEKGVSSSTKPLKNNTSTNDPRLFKLTHGQLWGAIESLTKSSNLADELYRKHNRKDLYSDAQEMWKGILEDYNQTKNQIK